MTRLNARVSQGRVSPGSARRRASRGVTLVELALVFAVLGSAAWVVGAWVTSQGRTQAQSAAERQLARARDALLAFAFTHARMPCPADEGGTERCDGRTEGRLPVATLGLPADSVGPMAYRLGLPTLSAPLLAAQPFQVRVPVAVAGLGAAGVNAATEAEASVDHATEVSGSLRAQPTPLRALAPVWYDGALDFCAVLASDSAAPAVVLTWVPVKGSSPIADARLVLGPADLWSRLGCGAAISVAGRSHFNAQLQAALMQESIAAYQVQQAIAQGLATWNYAQSLWFVASGAQSALKHAIKLEIALSAWLASLGQKPEPLAALRLAAVSMASSALNTAVYVSSAARQAGELRVSRETGRALDTLAADLAALQQETGRRALLSSTSPLALAPPRKASDDAVHAPLRPVPDSLVQREGEAYLAHFADAADVADLDARSPL